MVLLHGLFLLSVSLPHVAEIQAILQVVLLALLLIVVLESVNRSHESSPDRLGCKSIGMSTSGRFCRLVSLSLHLGRERDLGNLVMMRHVDVNLIEVYVLLFVVILIFLLNQVALQDCEFV